MIITAVSTSTDRMCIVMLKQSGRQRSEEEEEEEEDGWDGWDGAGRRERSRARWLPFFFFFIVCLNECCKKKIVENVDYNEAL